MSAGRKKAISLFSGFYPSMARVAKVVKILVQELDHVKQNRNGLVKIPRKRLEEKAKTLADQGEWASFIDILALLIFGVILFPNVEGLVDLAAINAFLAYHHSKESSVIAILADFYDTFDRRCEKSSARIEGRAGVLSSCEGFPNVPLMGTRDCINYNPVLAIRQLGYPMRGAPSKESIKPFIARGFSDPNTRAAREEEVETPEESEEVQTLKAELERAQAIKEKFKSTAIKFRKEYDELRDVNMATTEALE
ncbi:hypothetical protein GmHk_01G000896 [Glycine max]|nr:hypothetical protein GmHk_01G000896 [Glycine max]